MKFNFGKLGMRRNNEHEYVQKIKISSAWKEGDWLDRNFQLHGNSKRERLKKYM